MCVAGTGREGGEGHAGSISRASSESWPLRASQRLTSQETLRRCRGARCGRREHRARPCVATVAFLLWPPCHPPALAQPDPQGCAAPSSTSPAPARSLFLLRPACRRPQRSVFPATAAAGAPFCGGHEDDHGLPFSQTYFLTILEAAKPQPRCRWFLRGCQGLGEVCPRPPSWAVSISLNPPLCPNPPFP